MKKRKILYLFPLAALILSGCTFEEAVASAKSFMNNNIIEPAKSFVEGITGKKEEQKPADEEEQKPAEHVHTWGEWKVDGDFHYRVCTECGEKSEYEHHTGGTSSCEHKAVCEICGAEYGALDEHKFGEWKMEEGNAKEHYHECSICHEKEYADHVFDKEVVTDECLVGEKNNNCEEGNYYYKSCICGAHSTSEEDSFYVSNSHDFSLEKVLEGDANMASPATCNEPATYYYVCSHCGGYDSNHPEHVFTHGDAKGHNYGTLHEEECTFGTYHSSYYFCGDCGHYFEAVIEGGVTTYVEKEYDEIFDMSKIQYADETAGTEANPYIMKCKEDFTFLRDLVNDSNTFEGKYFRLANDVDFNNDEVHPFGSPIGYADAKPFSGTFDGENHKLMNIYIAPIVGSDNQLKKDALGLFSRVTNSTIKNLKIQNVTVKGEGQRCAGLVARLSGGTIENIEILSGNIEGTTECGGVVGCIVSNESKSFIKNCTNRATVKSIGHAYPCLGGILGAVVDKMEGDYEVDSCVNYGYIDASNSITLAYSGGIVGLIRAFKADTSYKGIISNNKNFGDVLSNRGTLGGIIGMPRAGVVENNYQSENASVTMVVDGVDYHPIQLYAQNFTVQIDGVNKGMKLGLIAGEVGSAASTDHNCCCDEEGHVAHKFAEGQPLTDQATCQHEGHNGYGVCELCGEVVGEIIPQLEHNMEYIITPTTHEHHCANEGCDYTEGPQPHNMILQPELHVDATTTSDGKDVYKCSICGYEEERVLKYKCAHCEDLEYIPGVSPTCHSEGNTDYYRCNVCGCIYSDSEANHEITLSDVVLPTVEHDFVKHEARVGFARSNEEYYTCSYADHDESEGAYFVKVGDQYVAKEYAEIFSDAGSYDLEGYGTEDNPYVIFDNVDFWAFRDAVNDAENHDSFAGKFVKLGADIDVTNDESISSIGIVDSRPFSGTFDGDNHKIIGFTYSSYDCAALFSRLTGVDSSNPATVKNLELKDINVSTTGVPTTEKKEIGQRAAALAARAENVLVENVSITGNSSIHGGGQHVGSIVAYAHANVSINSCVNNASIQGNGNGVGGVVGCQNSSSLSIIGCVNNGSVENKTTAGKMYTGGIFGAQGNGEISISGCINNGTVTSQSEGTGGIAGYFAGVGNKEITNCVNNGSVSGKSNGTGGILGSNAEFTSPVVTISNCVNKGNISGVAYVGGIVGLARGKNSAGSKASVISRCENYGNITGTSVCVGGIAGCARYNVKDCGCYYLAQITNAAGSKNAVDLPEYGEQKTDTGGGTAVKGYIVGTQGMSTITSITGSRLLNLDGTTYTA